jgi:hypothetical protein
MAKTIINTYNELKTKDGRDWEINNIDELVYEY